MGADVPDIMLDLETLGTRPGCIVLSIGAVAFDRHSGGIISEFYRVIDPESCIRAGLTSDPQTIAWWVQQSDAARAIFATPRADIHHLGGVAGQFQSFAGELGNHVKVWSHGLTFDLPIWEAASRAVLVDVPWHHWNARDTRTVYDLTGFNPMSITREGTYHNALDDARHQVRCLVAALHSAKGADHD
jgi:hypothetical protein